MRGDGSTLKKKVSYMPTFRMVPILGTQSMKSGTKNLYHL